MKNLNKLLKDSKGVSQIISVLVLTAVVIVGAIGAGMIMNTFSNEVADETSAAGIGAGAASELLIAGSTTVQPLSECLAKDYMDKNKGVRVVVQGGGSGAGVASTGLDIVDIGSASRDVKTSESDKWPEVQTHQIGGSAVTVIASSGCTLTGDGGVTKAELADLYENGTAPVNISVAVDKVYQRAESSGTEETFAKFITDKAKSDLDDWDAGLKSKAAVGNAGVLAAVEGASNCVVGFVDYGYAAKGTGINTLPVDGKTPDSDSIKDELKNQDGNYYVTKLTRPLNYLTKGDPSTIESDYLTFARSPGQKSCFDETGYFAVWEFA